MRSVLVPTAVFAIGAALATACLAEISDDELPEPTGPGGSGGGGFADVSSACEGACCPQVPECYPDGNPSAPGAECLAFRDNRGKDKVMLATLWRRNILPEATTADTTYGFLLAHSTPPVPQCNMRGQSGFIQIFEWTRSENGVALPIDPDLPIDQVQRVRTGFSGWMKDTNEVLNEGLCFLEFEHTDPPWRTAQVHVGSTTARRVAEDFDATDPDFRASRKGKEEGIVFIDEEKGTTHGYGDKGWVVIFEAENDVIAIPIHEVETKGRANNPDALNCVGRYRGDALDPNTAQPCQPASQSDPAYGCINDECEPGEGPASSTGYFLIEELEEVHNTILNQTLCVNYMGQQRAADEGWADPEDWGLNCRGSPRWKAGERPRGDWCSTTNGPATADCADAWRSQTVGAAVAMNIREDDCTTTAQ